MNVLSYEAVTFNADIAAKQSASAFAKEHAHMGLSEAQLGEAHALIAKTAQSAPKVEAPKPQVSIVNHQGEAMPEEKVAELLGTVSKPVGAAHEVAAEPKKAIEQK
jgi:hypothetical protein